MARKWHNEDWRKLYTRLEGQWLRLPALARGLASDLIKYADDAGILLRLRENEEVGEAISSMVGAQKWEAKTVARCADDLIADGYLVIDNGAVSIRNFVEAQTRRSPVAVKQQRYRDRINAAGNADRNALRNEAGNDEGNALRDSYRETRRDETRRDDPPNPQGETGGGLLSVQYATPPPLDFESVYRRYPRKEGKTPGMTKCAAQIKTPADLALLGRAVDAYAAMVRAENREATKILNFGTFMGRWRDYLDATTAAPANTSASAPGYRHESTRPPPKRVEVEDNPLRRSTEWTDAIKVAIKRGMGDDEAQAYADEIATQAQRQGASA